MFLYVFRTELRIFLGLLKVLPDLMVGQPVNFAAMFGENFELPGFLIFFGFNILGAVLIIFIMVYFIAGTVLPVRTGTEHWHAMEHFGNFVFGSRRPFMLVREGAPVQDEVPLKRSLSGGIALVDLTSALVLEGRRLRGRAIVEGSAGAEKADLSWRSMARIGKPGLVLVRRRERLRGIVSLRTQFRINLNVLQTSADGVEVKTHVFSMFTLGRPASVLKVAYCGEPVVQNLRVLNIDHGTKQIKSIADELDDVDKAEIHAFAQQYLQFGAPSTTLQPLERGKFYPPYHIDKDRIIAAVYERAVRVSDDKVESWVDLPARVATELFRSMFSQVDYEDLYLPDDPRKMPLLNTFKPTFARKMRHMGVLSYQFIYRLDGQLPAEGQRVDNRLFRISSVQDLKSPKTLRDCGIKVIHGGFSELIPTDVTVRQQRVDSWRAHWQQEADVIMAERERAVMKIKSRARARAQSQMIKRLSKVLGSSTYSEEAMALQVLQVIEEAASNPETRKLMPAVTLDMMRRMRRSLAPVAARTRTARSRPSPPDEKPVEPVDVRQEEPEIAQDEKDEDERQSG